MGDNRLCPGSGAASLSTRSSPDCWLFLHEPIQPCAALWGEDRCSCAQRYCTYSYKGRTAFHSNVFDVFSDYRQLFQSEGPNCAGCLHWKLPWPQFPSHLSGMRRAPLSSPTDIPSHPGLLTNNLPKFCRLISRCRELLCRVTPRLAYCPVALFQSLQPHFLRNSALPGNSSKAPPPQVSEPGLEINMLYRR